MGLEEWSLPAAMRHLESRIEAVEKSIAIALDAQRAQTSLQFKVITIVVTALGIFVAVLGIVLTVRH